MEWAVLSLLQLKVSPALLDLMFTLCSWEAALPADLRPLWAQFLQEHNNDENPDAATANGEPPTKRRPALFTEIGRGSDASEASNKGEGKSTHAASAADATMADVGEAGESGGPSAAPDTVSLLRVLRQCSSQLTVKYLASGADKQTADVLLCTLQAQALVLQLHALRFASIDTVLDLKKHVLVWEAALRRLGADVSVAPHYLHCLLNMCVALFCVPHCAMLTSTVKALLLGIVALPWICSSDAVPTVESEAYQVLNGITNVNGLQHLWREQLAARVSAAYLAASVSALALTPLFCGIDAPLRMLVGMLQQQADLAIQCAAVRTVPFFLASCRRHQRGKGSFHDFRDPFRALLSAANTPNEVCFPSERKDCAFVHLVISFEPFLFFFFSSLFYTPLHNSCWRPWPGRWAAWHRLNRNSLL